MNVTITGYATLRCITCNQSNTLESQSFTFEEDTGDETESDEYIRYQARIDTLCPTCSSRMQVNVDVWEFPAAVVNYCHYGEKGASDIQCEFTIDHYFDDQAVRDDDPPLEHPDDRVSELEGDPDDIDAHRAPPSTEVYRDQYDDDD